MDDDDDDIVDDDDIADDDDIVEDGIEEAHEAGVLPGEDLLESIEEDVAAIIEAVEDSPISDIEERERELEEVVAEREEREDMQQIFRAIEREDAPRILKFRRQP